MVTIFESRQDSALNYTQKEQCLRGKFAPTFHHRKKDEMAAKIIYDHLQFNNESKWRCNDEVLDVDQKQYHRIIFEPVF